MTVHDVDNVAWLTQAEVPELIYVLTHAHDRELAQSGVADTLTVVIRYKSGVVATKAGWWQQKRGGGNTGSVSGVHLRIRHAHGGGTEIARTTAMTMTTTRSP
jgi:predicted dehydrogenase